MVIEGCISEYIRLLLSVERMVFEYIDASLKTLEDASLNTLDCCSEGMHLSTLDFVLDGCILVCDTSVHHLKEHKLKFKNSEIQKCISKLKIKWKSCTCLF